MPRIPFSHLNALATQLNAILRRPASRWQDNNSGTKTNVGHMFIEAGSKINGQLWYLVEISNELGGERKILSAESRKELFFKMDAFKEGIRYARGLSVSDHKF